MVWLDHPRRVVLPRLLRRSVRRSFTRERIFGGNVGCWRAWLIRDHPFHHAVTAFNTRPATIGALAAAHHVDVVHLRTPDDLDRWLGTLVQSDLG